MTGWCKGLICTILSCTWLRVRSLSQVTWPVLLVFESLARPTTGHPFLVPLRRSISRTSRFGVICAVVLLCDCSLSSTQTMLPIDLAVAGYLPGLSEPFDASQLALSVASQSPLASSLFHIKWACLTHRRIASRRSVVSIPSSPSNRFSGRFVLGLPPFRGFSPSSPPDPLGSSIPPCRYPSCVGPTSRISAPGTIRRRPFGLRFLDSQTVAFSRVCVIHAVQRSLLSWLFPPFEVFPMCLPAYAGGSHSLQFRASCVPRHIRFPDSPCASTKLLSWASIASSSFGYLESCDSSLPRPRNACALQSVRDPVGHPGVTRNPSLGSSSDFSNL